MRKRPLRILYIAPCSPSERSFGTQLRASNVGRALKEIGDLHFVVTEFTENRAVASPSAGEFTVDRFVPLEKRPIRTFGPRLRSALDPLLVNPQGHRVGASDANWLSGHMEQFDLIWLHHLRTANVFERWAWPRAVMDIDDIPSTYLETVWRNAESWIDRLRARFRMRLAAKRERLLSERFPVLSVCSEADRSYLRVRGPIHVIPNGFEAPPAMPVRRPSNPPRIGFVGLFDYLPNAEGVRWFAEKCWPEIKLAMPKAELRLIGRDTDGPLKPGGPDIFGLGYLEDTDSEISTWSLMIVPIHFGAGTRVKIAEGFSRKVPMVATSVGAHGYSITNGVEILLADSASDFAGACLRVLQEPAWSAEMAERGWHRFQAEWSWEVIKPRVFAAAEDCLRLSGVKRTRPEDVDATKKSSAA